MVSRYYLLLQIILTSNNRSNKHKYKIVLIHGKIISEEQLIVILMDLFTAGAETTSTTLTWALINLITYPEVQKKIHDEIDNVLGNNQPTSEYKGR